MKLYPKFNIGDEVYYHDIYNQKLTIYKGLIYSIMFDGNCIGYNLTAPKGLRVPEDLFERVYSMPVAENYLFKTEVDAINCAYENAAGLMPQQPSFELLNKSIHDLELTVRSTNALITHKIIMIRDLVDTTPAKLRSFQNIGQRSFIEIKTVLQEHGLTLKKH